MKKFSVVTEHSYFTEEAESLEALKVILKKKYGITEYTAEDWSTKEWA